RWKPRIIEKYLPCSMRLLHQEAHAHVDAPFGDGSVWSADHILLDDPRAADVLDAAVDLAQPAGNGVLEALVGSSRNLYELGDLCHGNPPGRARHATPREPWSLTHGC